MWVTVVAGLWKSVTGLWETVSGLCGFGFWWVIRWRSLVCLVVESGLFGFCGYGFGSGGGSDGCCAVGEFFFFLFFGL